MCKSDRECLQMFQIKTEPDVPTEKPETLKQESDEPKEENQSKEASKEVANKEEESMEVDESGKKEPDNKTNSETGEKEEKEDKEVKEEEKPVKEVILLKNCYVYVFCCFCNNLTLFRPCFFRS